jgi:hypothetical protein
MIDDMNKAKRAAMLGALTMGLMGNPALAQDELWILNEGRFDWTTGEVTEAPSLGYIDMATLDYQQLLEFDGAAFAMDLEIAGDVAVVVLENRVVKVDLTSGQILASADLLGAQEAALLSDGTVVVTRGGVDPLTYEPLQLASFVVWLDGADLAFEGELVPSQGPSVPSQEIVVLDDVVYVGVNNGWEWGQEVGRLGRWSPQDGTYEEWDLGEDASNPVALHIRDGQLFTVNNGDWSSTSVTRVSLDQIPVVETAVLANVSAGCNASAFVGDDLALQIEGETGLRLLNGGTLLWSADILNPQSSAAYSLAVHNEYGWLCSGVTDFASFGEVQIHTPNGDLIATVPVGIAPGTLVWRTNPVSGLELQPSPSGAAAAAGAWDAQGRSIRDAVPGLPHLQLERLESGKVVKTVRVHQ